MRHTPLTAGLLAVSLALPAAAAAYPVVRAGHELDVSSQEPVLSRGAWVVEDGALRLENTERARNVWLAPSLGSGFHRLRVRDAAGAWVALLFRMTVHVSRPLRLRGYGVALNTRKGRLEFIRFDEGGVREPGVIASAEAIGERDDFEICLWHVGANFTATVYDAATKEALATVAWSDPSYREGAIGVQLAGRGGEHVRLSLSAGPVAEPPVERPWLAEQWLAVVDPSDAPAIPEHLNGQLRPLRNGRGGGLAFATSEAVVTALRERGVALLQAQPGIPFKYRDPGFAARSVAEITPTRTGITYLEGLKDDVLVASHLRAFADRFPELTRLEEIGRTVEDRPLLALRIADDPEDATRPVVLLCAAHHANEAITPELVLDAVRYLLERSSDPQVRAWLSSVAVVAVPLVNPDGSHAFWHIDDQLGRTNRRLTDPDEPRASGIDLNRNYPFRWGAVETRYSSRISSSNFYRGEVAGSEPEVAAMLRLGAREQPIAVISYHAAAAKLLVSYTSGDQPNPDPSVSWMLAEEIIAGMTHRFRGRRYEAARNLYNVSGTDQNWYLHAFGSVSYILEAPYSTPVRPTLLREAVTHSRYAWQYLLERWGAGPSLSVHVVDAATGSPLPAEISVDEMLLGAGEHWSARADTGWFHRYLPGEGTYTVRVRHGDDEAVEEILASAGVVTLEVEL